MLPKAPQELEILGSIHSPSLQPSQQLGILSPCDAGVTMNVTKLTAELQVSRAVGEQLCLDLLQQPGSLEQKSPS